MTTHSQTGSFDLSALNNLNQNLTQYFWFEEGGSGSYPWGLGAHVTLYPQSDFTDPNDSNYLKGQNILINTDGFSLRNGTVPLMVLDNDSLDFNLITDLSQGTYVNVATFGASGATIGQLGGAHSIIDTDGQRFYANDGTTLLANFGTTGAQIGVSGSGHTIIQTGGMQIYGSDGTVELANIGYGSGKTEQGGTADAPYYTLGVRTGSTKGNYSVVENWKNTASGFAAHAEGGYNNISGGYSHGEGVWNEATGGSTHVGGEGCHALANGSFVHGLNSYARGTLSTVFGNGTITNKSCQTVIGRFNVPETYTNDGDIGTYALIIGNGSSDYTSDRSNAFTVGWNGKVRVNADGYSNSQANVQVAVNDTNKLYFGVGSGGVNHGIYSHVRGGWIIYSDASSTHVPADLNVEGLLNVTTNSNTVTIGSQNANFCHIYNTANIPFIFNNSVMTTSGDLGSSTYKWGNLFLSGKIEMDGVLETKYVDLHASSGGASDYDCRLTTSAGSSTGQGLLHINGQPVKDFVKESGTSSSWYYRKWNSGKIEAWRTYNAGSQTPSQWVAGSWYYKDLDIAIPSGIFSSAPNHTIATNNGSDYQYTIHVARATSATNIRVRCVKPNSGAATPVIALYVSNMV